MDRTDRHMTLELFESITFWEVAYSEVASSFRRLGIDSTFDLRPLG